MGKNSSKKSTEKSKVLNVLQIYSIWLAEETLDEVEITGKQEENTEIS